MYLRLFTWLILRRISPPISTTYSYCLPVLFRLTQFGFILADFTKARSSFIRLRTYLPYITGKAFSYWHNSQTCHTDSIIISYIKSLLMILFEMNSSEELSVKLYSDHKWSLFFNFVHNCVKYSRTQMSF